jgi:hypothetical protein
MPKIPDAVKVPGHLAAGHNSVQRAGSIVDVAEALLGVDRSIGERGHCCGLPTGEFFCRKSPHDTLFFPHGHKLEGHPRYNWVVQDDGTTFGYLVAAAQPNPVASEVVANA